MIWPLLIAAAIGASAGGAASWHLGRAPLRELNAELRVENAGLRETHAESARLTALAAARRIELAHAAGRAAEERLTHTLTENQRLTQERKDALKTANTGAACLRDAALRVLDGSPGIRVARPGDGDQLPQAPGTPAAAPAAVATDTDVSGWIADVGERFEACRSQLHELIDWTDHPQQEPQGGPQQ